MKNGKKYIFLDITLEGHRFLCQSDRAKLCSCYHRHPIMKTKNYTAADFSKKELV